MNVPTNTAIVTFAFGLVAMLGIEDIPVLSYEAVMQHEREDSVVCRLSPPFAICTSLACDRQFLGDRCNNGWPYGTGPMSCPVCNVGVLWPNGWMDQDATWYGSRPRPRSHCITYGDPPLPRKGAQRPSPLFGPLCSGTVVTVSNC